MGLIIHPTSEDYGSISLEVGGGVTVCLRKHSQVNIIGCIDWSA